MSQQLLSRKLAHIAKTGATIVATGNPGCHLQIENGAKAKGEKIQVLHPVSLLAMAYRAEPAEALGRTSATPDSGRAKLRLSRGPRVTPGSGGTSP